VDAVRALLDGHVVLDRKLTNRNHYPPISVLDSISRLMTAVTKPEVRQKVGRLRRLLAAYAAAEDLIQVGAYQKGSDPVLDQAIAAMPAINAFLQQAAEETSTFDRTQAALMALPG
jgi:flagellum-specific ATP synthase